MTDNTAESLGMATAMLTRAMQQAAAADATAAPILASLSLDCATPSQAQATVAQARVTRATRSIVFAQGEVRSQTGELILAGSAVFRLA